MQAGGAAAEEAINGGVEVDPMAALDRATGVSGFVAATKTPGVQGNTEAEKAAPAGNADEIAMDEDDDDDE